MTDASTEQSLDSIAHANGVSPQAARALFDALVLGGGRMAQFSHPELGGMGQWSSGGMIMIGDMFNSGLKAKVDRLCTELADLAARQPAPSAAMGAGGGQRWWPEGLGTPSTAGAQNDMRYAFFPMERRLAIRQNGEVTLYDTGDHAISGVSQQQGGSYSLSFSSQHGPVDLTSLRRVTDARDAPAEKATPETPAPETPAPEARIQETSELETPAAETRSPEPSPAATPPAGSHDDVFAKLERLAALHKNGIVDDDEFRTKKAELLARL